MDCEAVVAGEVEIETWWRQYRRTRSDKLRARLVEHYLPFVRSTAERLAGRLPSAVDVDDLVGSGTLGLLDALDTFDPARKVKFETYSASRIYGAMIDELRALDWLTRGARLKERQLREAEQSLTQEFSRPPTGREVNARLGMTPEKMSTFRRSSSAARFLSFSQRQGRGVDERDTVSLSSIPDPRAVDPANEAARESTRDFITRGLTEAQRLVILLYYCEEMTMKEIGLTLELSESRVSQMRAEIVKRLRARLGDDAAPARAVATCAA